MPAPEQPGRPTRTRAEVFALVTLVWIVLAIAYGIVAKLRMPRESAAASAASLPPPPADLRLKPYVIFLSADAGAWGRVLLAETTSPDAPRYAAGRVCDRVYFAAGRGVCLTPDTSTINRYRLEMFDETFQTTTRLDLPGYPSRARVSPDGRYAAFTVFVVGHSYAVTGFSTRTEIIDLSAGKSLGDLETFTIARDGQPLRAADVNFWGVTFVAGSPRFYATLATGGRTYLVEGNIDARMVLTLRENAECPSLSPDGTRLVFKRRLPTFASFRWQLTVLDLRTMRETPLTAESSSVDDQAEWLDDDEILYGIPDRSGQAAAPPDLWAIRADGSGPPRLFLANALSPAVVRGSAR